MNAERRIDTPAPSARATVRTQVAALCWRRGSKGVEVLLVTTRRSGRWIIPKGWQMRGRSDAESAAQEAWEEAGVVPKNIKNKSIGEFGYTKDMPAGRGERLRVDVFKIKVKKLVDRFPERGQRKRRWVSPKRAIKMVREPELKQLLLAFHLSKKD